MEDEARLVPARNVSPVLPCLKSVTSEDDTASLWAHAHPEDTRG